MDDPTSVRQADVFVSYAREDLSFVRRLKTLLEEAGLRAWIDLDGLYSGEAFWPEVCRAIDAASAVAFVLTPSSAGSVFCRRELIYAMAGHKRLVPVCRHDLDPATVPDGLAALQWVFFRADDDVHQALGALLLAIRADWTWLRHHARLAVRAEEWTRHTQLDDGVVPATPETWGVDSDRGRGYGS